MFNKNMPIFCNNNIKIADIKGCETASIKPIVVSNNNPYVAMIKKILTANCENAL